MEESLISYILTMNNWVDLLTKVMYGQTRRHFVGEVMYNIYD